MNKKLWFVMLADGADFNQALEELCSLGFTPVTQNPSSRLISWNADDDFGERAEKSGCVEAVQCETSLSPRE